MVNKILLVDNNIDRVNTIKRKIKEHTSFDDITVTMNGGHALLYLDHINLSNKIENFNILILLNIHTPVVDGFEFLRDYRDFHLLKKDRIQIVIIDDGLHKDEIEKLYDLGESNFCSLDVLSNNFSLVLNLLDSKSLDKLKSKKKYLTKASEKEMPKLDVPSGANPKRKRTIKKTVSQFSKDNN